jgi:hypothetical protein
MNEFRPLNNEEQDRVMKLALEYQRQELELRDLHELQSIGEQIGVKPEHVERAYAAVLTNTDPIPQVKVQPRPSISVTDVAMTILNIVMATGVATSYPAANNAEPIYIGLAVLLVTSFVVRLRSISVAIAAAWSIALAFTLPRGLRPDELYQPILIVAIILFFTSLGARDLGERVRTWLSQNDRAK